MFGDDRRAQISDFGADQVASSGEFAQSSVKFHIQKDFSLGSK